MADNTKTVNVSIRPFNQKAVRKWSDIVLKTFDAVGEIGPTTFSVQFNVGSGYTRTIRNIEDFFGETLGLKIDVTFVSLVGKNINVTIRKNIIEVSSDNRNFLARFMTEFEIQQVSYDNEPSNSSRGKLYRIGAFIGTLIMGVWYAIKHIKSIDESIKWIVDLFK